MRNRATRAQEFATHPERYFYDFYEREITLDKLMIWITSFSFSGTINDANV